MTSREPDVLLESQSGATDDLLWCRVYEEGRFLVTLDTDFADVRRFAPGTHPGILLLRSTHPSNCPRRRRRRSCD